MEHREFDELLKKYVNGDLSEKENERFREHLVSCRHCQQEMNHYDALEDMMKKMRLKDPEEAMWEGYWASIYNRLERGFGWIIFSIGAIILVFYGLFKLVEQLIADPTVAIMVKAGILALLLGLAVLVVSILRQQLFAYRKERYREVQK
jgi:hypothetical protein